MMNQMETLTEDIEMTRSSQEEVITHGDLKEIKQDVSEKESITAETTESDENDTMPNQMEVLSEAQGVTLNRSSTLVTFNADLKGSKEDTSDEDNFTEEELTESDENNEHMKFRLTGSVAFNTEFEKEVKKSVSSNHKPDDKETEKHRMTNKIEVLTEADDVKLNRSSTLVTLNADFKGNKHDTSDEDSFTEEELTESDENSIFENSDQTSKESDPEESESENPNPPTDEPNPEEYIFSMIEDSLDNGIIIRYPENYRFRVPYVCRHLQLLDRNAQLAELTETLAESKLITDMFGVYHKNPGDGKDSLVSLPFDNCEGEILVSVSIKARLSPHMSYYAHLRRNTNWEKHPVQIKDGIAEFNGCTFDIFFLAAQPIIETIILDPEGKEFISMYDNKTKLIFPQNCVTKREVLQIQIIPQSNVVAPIYMDDEPCILGATKSIHVKHRKGIFMEPIEVHLHMCLFDKSTDPDLTIYNFVDVHAVNKQEGKIDIRQLSSENYLRVDRGFALCMKVDDFDSHSVQLGIQRKMITETGKLRARMAQDEIFHCHIIVFVSENAHSYQGKCVRIDCVESKDVQETINKMQNMNNGFIELTGCRSPPLFLKDGERMRISLQGGMKLPYHFNKSLMMISFLREGLHKYIVFPFESQFGNRPTHVGYLDFNRAEGHKELIYQTFFDVDFPFKKIRRGMSTAPSLETLDNGSLTGSQRGMSTAPSLETLDNGSLTGSQRAPSSTSLYSDSHSPLKPAASNEDSHLWTEINNFLSKQLIGCSSWKSVLRAIMCGSGVDADNIISEAEQNNKDNLRDAIYTALRIWTVKNQLETSRQIFDAVIKGLKDENYEQIITDVKENFGRCFSP